MIDFNAVRAEFSLVDVAARYLPELKRAGTEYVARCPFHNDSSPSFTVWRGQDGLFRFKCFPCGMHGDVIDFVAAIENVEPAEAVRRLTGQELPRPGAFTPAELPADESECWVPILPVPADAPQYDPAATYNPRRAKVVRWRPTRLDAVHDASGALLGYVARLDFDGDKLCPVITYCEGPDGRRAWAAKRFPRPYPLVGLRGLAKRPKDAVLVVSGEKCRAVAESVFKGFVCVTWIGGDDAVDHADVEPLRGRNLTLWPDADESGRRAMARLAERLS